MNRMRVAAACAGVAVALGLTGCAPSGPTPTPTPTAEPFTASAVPTATASPTGAPAALAIPECEAMVSIELARASFSEFTEYLGELSTAVYLADLASPELVAASAGATPARACLWGVPNSDGGFTLFVGSGVDGARIQAELIAEGFSSVTMGTVTAMEATFDTVIGSRADTHLFTGDVWIVAHGTDLSLSGMIAGAALDAMRAANPSFDL
ncbi:hypothetical protein QMG83_00720 [Salinibacterium sp. G-O1]|uniref:hypothetical protein n=1 Tax=Salinibacterium sp. G-O1 TaxID=3046208 RepID=UPI0024B9B145|nr:hypothetical protein [Salinibacterium sp. G-O1]MDJ0333737.1 hypothetical protein [Salinibacterium sp. G-O1]